MDFRCKHQECLLSRAPGTLEQFSKLPETGEGRACLMLSLSGAGSANLLLLLHMLLTPHISGHGHSSCSWSYHVCGQVTCSYFMFIPCTCGHVACPRSCHTFQVMSEVCDHITRSLSYHSPITFVIISHVRGHGHTPQVNAMSCDPSTCLWSCYMFVVVMHVHGHIIGLWS